MTTHKFAEASDSDPPTRYAIYWAPRSGSLLAQLGNAWLGRDAERDLCAGGLPSRPSIPEFTAEQLDALTAEPRRYALHATLKPPFVLAEGKTFYELRMELASFAKETMPFQIPRLELQSIGKFLALVPSGPSPELNDLASRCVAEFDKFRRPASAQELSRRRATGLDAVEEANLHRWGYPYVMERFRFHLTLTGPLDAERAKRIFSPLAEAMVPATAEPLQIRDIALFVEMHPAGSFRLEERFELAAQNPYSS